MGTRRSNHEGTIFREKTGLWVAEVYVDGKKTRKRSKNQKVVREWLLEQREAIKKGLWVEDTKVTVAQFFDRYYEEIASHTLRPKTLVSYESIIRLHIKPDLGELRLVQLTPGHLQSLYSKKLNSGLSNRTVQYIHAVIHRVLGQALKWGLVARNVADVVEAPKPAKTAPIVLTEDQVKQLLDASEGRLKVVLILAATCGLRQAEILGLRWEDVGFSESSIYIRQTAQTIHKQGILITEPKTDKGRRSIILPFVALDALMSYQSQTGETEGLIFHTSTGKPISARNLIRDFKSVLEKAGLPNVKFHSLRHFHATSLLKKNVNPKIVQERLGHSRISETLDTYSHVIPTLQQEAADKVDEIFKA